MLVFLWIPGLASLARNDVKSNCDTASLSGMTVGWDLAKKIGIYFYFVRDDKTKYVKR